MATETIKSSVRPPPGPHPVAVGETVLFSLFGLRKQGYRSPFHFCYISLFLPVSSLSWRPPPPPVPPPLGLPVLYR